jgi:glycyl-tRNA synthetase
MAQYKINNLMEKIVSLCKRRGFIFPGSEIYGGINGFYDFGPLGVELKFNIKQEWWKEVVRKRDDVVGLSAAIIMNPKVWEASGHVTGFSDPLIECPNCHHRFLADEIRGNCVECGTDISDLKPRQFNLMFKTFVGPVESSASVAYLRPETAGGIFVNFKNVLDTSRLKIPFGIAQIGKAFRNEVNPKDFIFRTREFEQMELEYFVKPGDDKKHFKEWVEERFNWYKNLGLKNIRKREVPKEELAHYSRGTTDIEYNFPFGWREIEGIANRGDFDLKTHSQYSGENLSYTDPESGEKYIPFVIEPSSGVDRIALAFLCEAYAEEKGPAGQQGEKESARIILKLHPKLAPYKAAVFPLLANKPRLVKLAREIYENLRKHFLTAWDDRGNIGKRYYSQDEIGTPFCITVDFQSLEDKTVTIRDRDTAKQERIVIWELLSYLEEKLMG